MCVCAFNWIEKKTKRKFSGQSVNEKEEEEKKTQPMVGSLQVLLKMDSDACV